MRRSLVGGIAAGLVSCLVATGLTVTVPAVGLEFAQSGAAELAGDGAASEQEAASLDAGPQRDAAAAMEAARLHDSPVEDLSQRTESSQTFALPDGAWSTEITSGPVRVENRDGSWSPIDTTLVRAESGGWGPRAVSTGLVFSDGGYEPFVSMDLAAGSSLGLRWPDRLPDPVVEGSRLTYAGVVPGGDLVVEALPTGFSHSIVLHKAPEEPLNLRFPLELDGVALTEGADGALSVRRTGGGEVAEAAAPLMWDAATGPSGSPENVSEFATRVDTSTSTPTLILTPDVEVLQDPDTEYPVTIDPTFTADHVLSDTWVQNVDFTTGQGSSTELRAGSYDSGATKARSFVKFDIAAVRDTQILDADLKLRNWRSWTCTAGVIRVGRITEPWPSPITWTDQPIVTNVDSADFSPAHGNPDSACAASVDAVWDVTSIVRGWADDSLDNLGVRVKAVDETGTNTWRRYRSNEYVTSPSAQPRLVILHNNAPGTPSTLAVAPCVASCTPVVTDSTTPTLSAKATDDDGGQLTYGYQVREVGTTAVVASGSTGPRTEDTTATWTVPADQQLLDLTDYEFRVSASDGNATTWSGWKAFSVDVDQPPTTPTDLKVAPCLGDCSPVVTDTLTPDLSALATDSDTATLSYDFEVRQSATTAVVASGSISGAQGTAAAWTVTPGTLTDQGSYEFRVAGRDAKSTTWSGWQPFAVDVDQPPTTPAQLAVSPCVGVCSEVVTDTVAPKLSAVSADPDSTQVTYRFQVRTVGQQQVLAEGASSSTPQGTGGAWSVPEGVLVDGSSYEFRAGAQDAQSTTWSDWKGFAVDLGGNGSGPTWVTPGSLSADQTWGPEGSPYVIDGTVSVGTGRTLTLLPGTVVKFFPTTEDPVDPTSFNFSMINVSGGRLVADGTAAKPIVITSYHDDTVGGNTNGAGRAPARGDWYHVRFSGGIDTPVSVMDNVSVRYGGEGSSIMACQTSSAVEVTNVGRLRVTSSEFVHAKKIGLSFQVLVPGVGVASVSNTRFADSNCGMSAQGGDVRNNVFEKTLDRPLAALYPERLRFHGNWVYEEPWIAGNAPTRADADLRDNALLGGVSDNPSNQDHTDLAYNWWGPTPSQDTGCFDYNKTYSPSVTYEYRGSDDLCSPTAYQYVTGYFTKVTPMLASAPGLPEAGIGADPFAHTTIPDAQTFGAAGAGSEFAYRPTGLQADPVNSATGSYLDQATDAALASLGAPLAATRTYNSADTASGSLGRGWSFGYDQRLTFPDRDTTVFVAGDGQRVEFTRQPDGTWARDAGATATLTRDGDGGYALTTRAQMVHRFDAAGQVRSVLDRNGLGVTFTHDQDGRLTTATSGNRSLRFTYTTGYLSRVDLPDGRFVAYGYTNGLLTSVRDLAGQTTTYGYDTGNRLNSETNPLGVEVMRLAYDPATGRARDQWDALNGRTSFGWDPVEEVATMTDPRGGTWVDDYAGNVLTTRTDPLGRTTSYEYDTDVQLVAATTPRGIRSTFTYDAAGDLVSTTGAQGTVTTQYNSAHGPVSAVNARGTETRFGYDERGNLTSLTRIPAGGSRPLTDSYTVDARGLVTAATDPAGNTTTSTYTADGDLATVTTPEGRTSSHTYDPVGRLATSVDPRGNQPGADPAQFTTSYTYNARDQITEVTNPLGHSSLSTYDDAGQLTTSTDAKGRVSRYTYDDAGHMLSTQGPDPAVPAATATYDANGNIKTSTDPAGRTISYGYDLANQPSTATGPLGAYTLGHDKSGNLTSVKNPANQTITMGYTAANLLTSINYPDATPDVAYAYDTHGNRTSMTDGSGTVTYAYDGFDRLTTVTRGANTFTYAYDKLGLITDTSNPVGRDFAYGYDREGMLTSVTDTDTPTTLAGYTYDSAGAPATGQLADGSEWSRAYDRAGRLTRLTDTAADGTKLLDDTYTLDPAGNPTQIGHADGSTDTYTYDQLDRLTGVCHDTASCDGATDYIGWAYDPAGNRTSETRPAGTTDYTYAPATGLLASVTKPGGTTTSYTHDTLGRLKTAGTTSYAYNLADRLTTQTTAGASTSYTYDGDGRRLKATNPGGTTNFVWDPRSYQLVAETDANAAPIRSYSYGLGRIGANTADGTASYYHADAQGSVRSITDATGAVDWQRSYEPYGVIRSEQQLDPAAPGNPIGYAGEYTNPGGTSHLRARQYDPTLGAFTTPDPAAATNWSGTTTYANANPMTAGDPYGLWPDLSDVVDVVNDWGPEVTTVLGLGAVGSAFVFPPAAPILGGLAALSGGITAAASAYTAWDTCTNGAKGACGGAVTTAALNTTSAVPGAGLGVLALRGSLGRAAANSGPSIGARVKAWTGREYKFGPNFRIAPFGNRTGHSTGRYPHYHRRVVDDAGETLPGQGIGRHRPWDKKSTDTSFGDRF